MGPIPFGPEQQRARWAREPGKDSLTAFVRDRSRRSGEERDQLVVKDRHRGCDAEKHNRNQQAIFSEDCSSVSINANAYTSRPVRAGPAKC